MKLSARKRRLNFEVAQVIRDRYIQGETQVELAKVFNVSQVSISRIVNNEVWTGPRKRKLTNEQVQDIRYRHLTEKITFLRLAIDFKLTVSEVQAILNRTSYNDVGPSEKELLLRKELDELPLNVVEVTPT